MKNLIYSLGKKSMLPLLFTLVFFSCKKDDASLDEYRYRRYLSLRRTTTSTDTTTSTGGTTGGTTTGGTTTGGTTTGGTTTGGTTTNVDGWNPPANTRHASGFENGLTDGFNKYIQQPYSSPAYVTKSSEQKAGGSYSAKFYMTSDAAQATGESHAQLTKIDIETLNEGDERWYENDYFLAAPYTSDMQYIRQWHHDYSDYSPPIALCTVDGKLKWDYVTSLQGKDNFYDLGTAPVGKWFNVKIHIIFSATSGKALTEVWIDNVKKMTLTAPNKFAQYGNLEMIGIYHWQWKSTSYKGQSSTIYIDNYKVW